MRKPQLIIVLLFAAIIANAQGKKIDTLRYALSKAVTPNSIRLDLLKQLTRVNFSYKPDSALFFAQQYYELAVKLDSVKDEAIAVNSMANSYSNLGDYFNCFRLYFKAIKIYRSINYVPGIEVVYSNIGDAYVKKQDYVAALHYLKTGMKEWDSYLLTHKLATYNQKKERAFLYLNTAEVFLYSNKIDSADHYLRLCYPDAELFNVQEILASVVRDLGEVETARSHKVAAINYYRDAISIAVRNEDFQMLSVTYLSAANLYHKYKQQDSAEYYGQKAFEIAVSNKFWPNVLNASDSLASYYAEYHNLSLANKYLKATIATKDSIIAQDNSRQLLSSSFDEKQKEREIASIELNQKHVLDNIRMYIIIAGIFLLLLFAFIFWRGNKQKQKAYNG